MTEIIGISGISGAGKSTLGNALAKELNATAIHWDEFDEISIWPEDYVRWYHSGQNYDEWNYSALAEVLKLIKSEQSVLHPVHHYCIKADQYLVFDAPMGRLHKQTGQYIDRLIHIDVPLDVSLCRRLLRDYKNKQCDKQSLLDELKFYINESRPLFFDDQLKINADLIIDGLHTTEKQIHSIKSYLSTTLIYQ